MLYLFLRFPSNNNVHCERYETHLKIFVSTKEHIILLNMKSYLVIQMAQAIYSAHDRPPHIIDTKPYFFQRNNNKIIKGARRVILDQCLLHTPPVEMRNRTPNKKCLRLLDTPPAEMRNRTPNNNGVFGSPYHPNICFSTGPS